MGPSSRPRASSGAGRARNSSLAAAERNNDSERVSGFFVEEGRSSEPWWNPNVLSANRRHGIPKGASTLRSASRESVEDLAFATNDYFREPSRQDFKTCYAARVPSK